MITLEELLNKPSTWFLSKPDAGIAISSRVRLARNLRDAAFPGWAGEEECEKVWQTLTPVLSDCTPLKSALVLNMDGSSALNKQVLYERHLISREHAERKKGRGVVIREDEAMVVMVNEEDHLRLQAMRPGLNLKEAWKEVDGLDNEIESHVRYAFSSKIGYLTACPTNVGTGMRASVMLHMPGMVLLNEMNAVMKGMAKIGLAVRGLWGEGSEAAGNIFQVSNQMTLGEREEDIVSNLEQIVLELVEHERNARARLMQDQEEILRDKAGRAMGILTHAHVLTSKEALDLLSDLRLGIDMGIVGKRLIRRVNELLILTQPGHLQRLEGRRLKAMERDVARARLLRERLAPSPRKTSRKKT